jgi:hypothetical protein
MNNLRIIHGKGKGKKHLKGIPKFVVITDSPSPIAWFRHLIGQTFEVLDVSPYGYIKICYDKELQLYGWLPLSCCRPHLYVVRNHGFSENSVDMIKLM